MVGAFRGGRVLISLIVALGLENSTRFMGRLARVVAPAFKQHSVALANIALSFPEKTPAEHRRIRAEMWDNLGRTVAEAVHFEELTRRDPATGIPPRLSHRGVSRHLEAARRNERGAIYFSAHLANWELAGVSLGMVGLPSVLLFRRPQGNDLAAGLGRLREKGANRLVESSDGAAAALAKALRNGERVAVMMDLKFPGPTMPFLGRPAGVMPIVGRLARLFDVPVYGVRVVRQPGSRFVFEIGDALDLPRDDRGQIDADGATAVVNGVVEGWVRENPQDWFWVYDRWRSADAPRQRRAGAPG